MDENKGASHHSTKEACSKVPVCTRNNIFRRAFLFCFAGIPVALFWIVGGSIAVGLFFVTGGASDDEQECNVLRIPLHGVLVAISDESSSLFGIGGIVGADKVLAQIQYAQDTDTVRGVLFDVNSPGGTPVAADEVMSAFLALEKPTVTVVHDLGASAAYWASAGTDHIIASPISDVGSIGVTMSYVEVAGANESEGSRWVDISSGVFKDAGNPDRVLRSEEQEYFRDQVQEVYRYMMDRIVSARPAITQEAQKELKDGRAYLGTRAYALGLIDEVGGIREAQLYLAHRLSLDEDEIVLCSAPENSLIDLLR